MSGKVVHFEIPADDIDRARLFYRDVFGWALTEVPGMDYTMVVTTPSDDSGTPREPGAINGGMFARTGDFARFTAPNIVIDVADVDAALATVQKAGGTVLVPKMPVGEMGFCGYFTDPEGNVLGVWQGA
ncbi:MAG: VOC family protein [Mycobacteriaceae bacterium]|nr:VOC family protein [Mycobacteriaceae bacterium]